MEGQYVLIGNSAAALAAIDAIRKFDGGGSIVLLNREHGPAYSRVALPYYVAGEMTLEDLLIRQRADYQRLGVELVEDASVVAVDAGAKQVVLADGRKLRFGKLLLGTGSGCSMPPISGLEAVPHHYLWTLDDAKGLRAAAQKARRAVLIGGGFIGMLAAEALRKLNLRLTIVEMASQLLPQLLDAEGGRRFSQAVAEAGVTLRLGATVAAVAANNGEITVTLEGGEALLADLLVVAAGVEPNVGFLRNGPCVVNRGVVVDEWLETDCADIFAAGDVAEVKDFLGGDRTIHAIWPAAVEQGRIAGANMAGQRLTYAGSLGMNVVTLFNLTLAQLGRFREAPGDEVQLLSNTAAAYRKVVVSADGGIAGAMYLGDENGVAEMGVINGLIKRRASWREFADYKLPRFTYATTIYGRGQHGPRPRPVR
ncbi:MAG: FAD-dependent oxidoreductase [Deltaproteobacteria bacterium]|nr:FAD-dependent oxidoreductase [Deltaproteobacteria bacterium]